MAYLTEFFIEVLDTEVRVSNVVFVVGNPWTFAFLGHLMFTINLNNIKLIEVCSTQQEENFKIDCIPCAPMSHVVEFYW